MNKSVFVENMFLRFRNKYRISSVGEKTMLITALNIFGWSWTRLSSNIILVIKMRSICRCWWLCTRTWFWECMTISPLFIIIMTTQSVHCDNVYHFDFCMLMIHRTVLIVLCSNYFRQWVTRMKIVIINQTMSETYCHGLGPTEVRNWNELAQKGANNQPYVLYKCV